jgi:hypothetical protein
LTSVYGAVEGLVDEVVAQRLITEVGGQPTTIYGKRGKDYLRTRIGGYNNAARFAPWLVLVDLDDVACPAALCQDWLPRPSELMRFRVAVCEVESWLMADRERFARFIGVSQSQVPNAPDELPDPKARVIELARQSRRRDIREELVPHPRSGRHEGPLYTSRLVEFAHHSWRPRIAASLSESLRRCIARLAELTAAE